MALQRAQQQLPQPHRLHGSVQQQADSQERRWTPSGAGSAPLLSSTYNSLEIESSLDSGRMPVSSTPRPGRLARSSVRAAGTARRYFWQDIASRVRLASTFQVVIMLLLLLLPPPVHHPAGHGAVATAPATQRGLPEE